MLCCTECFHDEILKEIIGNKTQGNCDICGISNVNVFDTINNDLTPYFNDLLDLYTTEISNSDYKSNLEYELKYTWEIFKINIPYKKIVNMLQEICPDFSGMFHAAIEFKFRSNKSFVEKEHILRGMSWQDFREELIHKNRFYNDVFNQNALRKMISLSIQNIESDTKLFRARICHGNIPFPKTEMGAPPKECTPYARANPSRVRCLYLANDENTTLHEIRASVRDYVTIGEFIPTKDLKVIDINFTSHVSPFSDIKKEEYALNMEIINEIISEISKPIRNADREIEYIPTQYITEFVKYCGYDGIKFNSTLSTDGYNVAIFDCDNFRCTKATTKEIKDMKYTMTSH